MKVEQSGHRALAAHAEQLRAMCECNAVTGTQQRSAGHSASLYRELARSRAATSETHSAILDLAGQRERGGEFVSAHSRARALTAR
jgi:hypothetical protein